MGILRRLFGDTTSTNVLELLTAQHAEMDELFERIENGEGNRRALLVELADKLAAHATVEEKVFYPAVMSAETRSMLHESVEEHLGIKRELADLITMRLDDDHFKAKLKVLKEYVSHHAHKEEEHKMFPLLKKLLSGDQLAAIGNEVLVMYEELIATSPSKNVPNETTEAAPLPPA
jgi:iron-sulfur cluster repair protein YtfE (RIC family)